jgi:hypothetical protein
LYSVSSLHLLESVSAEGMSRSSATSGA